MVQITALNWFMDESTIGHRLRKLRKANGMTQDHIAEICGVTKSMVSQWESSDGASIPTDRVISLRKKIVFSSDWLLFGVEETDQVMRESLRALLGVAEKLPDYAVVKLTREGDTYAQLLEGRKDDASNSK